MKKTTNKFYQRALALVLALMLCVGMMPMAAFAEGENEPAPEVTQSEPAPVENDPVTPGSENPDTSQETSDPAPETPDEDEDETPADGEKPAEGQTPAEGENPDEGQAPAEDVKPDEGQEPEVKPEEPKGEELIETPVPVAKKMAMRAASSATDGKTIYAGTVSKYVGDTGFYQRLPRLTYVHQYCGHVASEYIPGTDYNASFTDTDDEFLDLITLSNNSSYKGGAEPGDGFYVGYPCFEVDYRAIKPTTSTRVDIDLYYCYNAPAETGYCDWCGYKVSTPANYKTYKDDISFDVTVYARYQLNYNTMGGSYVASTQDDKTTTTATLSVTSTEPEKTGYEFDGWYYDEEYKNPVGGSVILNWSTGLGGKDNPVFQSRAGGGILPAAGHQPHPGGQKDPGRRDDRQGGARSGL